METGEVSQGQITDQSKKEMKEVEVEPPKINVNLRWRGREFAAD